MHRAQLGGELNLLRASAGFTRGRCVLGGLSSAVQRGSQGINLRRPALRKPDDANLLLKITRRHDK